MAELQTYPRDKTCRYFPGIFKVRLGTGVHVCYQRPLRGPPVQVDHKQSLQLITLFELGTHATSQSCCTRTEQGLPSALLRNSLEL